MAGRPLRRNAVDLIERLESARSSLGMSRAAMARRLGTCPSNLSRSMGSKALSTDMAARVEVLLEELSHDMRKEGRRPGLGDATLRQALILLQEFIRIAPDLERALVRALRDAAGEAR